MARSKKKTIIEDIRLENYAAEGKCVAHLPDGKTLFVKGGVPGDVVAVLIQKNKPHFAEGQVVGLKNPSPDRVTPFCEHFGICGGCKWQMLPYDHQLKYKQEQVAEQLHRIGKIELPPLQPILGCEKDRLYRNKLEFTFSALSFLAKEQMAQYKKDEVPRHPVLGFHAPGFFDKIVDIDTCWLQEEPTNRIKNWLREWALESGLPFYNSRSKEGWWRNLIIRISTLGEVMVHLIVKEEHPFLEQTLAELISRFPEITSLNYTINPKLNDTLYGLPVHTYHGQDYIEEHLGKFRFHISPKSFFQTNSKQAERLYQVVAEFAQLSGTERVYDLYCGTGSIGIFLSDQAGQIIGIETVADAVEDAHKNALLNGCENCSFYTGDVAQIATDEFFERHGRPDVIITDPPRPGMSEALLQQLLRIKAPKIVYVSCNPATQARDLNYLDELYKVERLQPVDMFPQTHHIENVALLTLK